MTGWHALVPIKQGAGGKSRLSGVLDPGERRMLVRAMAEQVLAVLGQCGAVDRITIISPERPYGWQGDWLQDRHRGLNAEIAAWRAGLPASAALVVHADLPLIAANDIDALLDLAAAHGAAMATDRAGQGTNALALRRGGPFRFHFGPDSRARHVAQFPGMPVLQRPGLIADLDTPEDLAFVRARGFRIPPACRWEGPVFPVGSQNHSDRSAGECVR